MNYEWGPESGWTPRVKQTYGAENATWMINHLKTKRLKNEAIQDKGLMKKTWLAAFLGFRAEILAMQLYCDLHPDNPETSRGFRQDASSYVDMT